MAWSCGIVGLPNAGKSTLFKALTAQNVAIENYPFSTVDPNKAIVPIPDIRLSELADRCSSNKVTPAVLEVIDVAGLVRGASKGEGMGNQFLGHLRDVNLLLHVLSGFSDADNDVAKPIDRLDIINMELILADLEMIARRRIKLEPKVRSGEKEVKKELELLLKLEKHLDQGFPLRTLDLLADELQLLNNISLLTLKKVLYVYNVSEDNLHEADTSFFPDQENLVVLCGSLEAELVDLPREERYSFLQLYGLEESRTEMLLAKSFNLLNLITFYTVKGEEARAWIVPEGIPAVKAAGKVHTDMEAGFINVEVISYENLVSSGSLVKAREKGISRVEGKQYSVQDGDVLYFRFRD